MGVGSGWNGGRGCGNARGAQGPEARVSTVPWGLGPIGEITELCWKSFHFSAQAPGIRSRPEAGAAGIPTQDAGQEDGGVVTALSEDTAVLACPALPATTGATEVPLLPWAMLSATVSCLDSCQGRDMSLPYPYRPGHPGQVRFGHIPHWASVSGGGNWDRRQRPKELGNFSAMFSPSPKKNVFLDYLGNNNNLKK